MRTGHEMSQIPFAGSLCLLFSSAQWGCSVLIWNFLGKTNISLVPLTGPWVVACSFWWVETQKSFNYLTHHRNHGSKLGTSDVLNYDNIWFYHSSSHIFMKKRLSGILEALLQKTETQLLICAYRMGTNFFKLSSIQGSPWTIPCWHYLFLPPIFKRDIEWGKLSDIIVSLQSSQAKGKSHRETDDGFLRDSCMVCPMPGGSLPVMTLRHLASWVTEKKKKMRWGRVGRGNEVLYL